MANELDFQLSSLSITKDSYNAKISNENYVELRAWMLDAQEKLPINTIKAYIYDWNIFHKWSLKPSIPWSNFLAPYERRDQSKYEPGEDKHLTPFYSLPAHYQNVIDFIDAHVGFIAPATLKRIVSTISKIHKVAMLADPTAHERVKLSMKRIGNGLSKKQKYFGCPHHNLEDRNQARPMRIYLLEKVRNHEKWQFGELKPTHDLTEPEAKKLRLAQKDRLIILRNLGILYIAYDALLRSEDVAHIELHQIRFDDKGAGCLKLLKSKANQKGEPSYHFLAKDTCDFLKLWIKVANIETGPLFAQVSRWGKIGIDKHSQLQKGLTERSVLDVFYKASLDIGIGEHVKTIVVDKNGKEKPSWKHVNCFSSHSARIGCLLDLRQNKTPMIEMMQAGRWKSELMILNYTKQYDIYEGGTANLTMVQGRNPHAIDDEGFSY